MNLEQGYLKWFCSSADPATGAVGWDCIPLKSGKVSVRACVMSKYACVCSVYSMLRARVGVDIPIGTGMGVGLQHPEETASPWAGVQCC